MSWCSHSPWWVAIWCIRVWLVWLHIPWFILYNWNRTQRDYISKVASSFAQKVAPITSGRITFAIFFSHISTIYHCRMDIDQRTNAKYFMWSLKLNVQQGKINRKESAQLKQTRISIVIQNHQAVDKTKIYLIPNAANFVQSAFENRTNNILFRCTHKTSTTFNKCEALHVTYALLHSIRTEILLNWWMLATCKHTFNLGLPQSTAIKQFSTMLSSHLCPCLCNFRFP